MKDVYELADHALKDVPLGERIIRKIRGSFQMSQSEQLPTFCEELGLQLAERERAAIRAWNSPAHGGGSATSDGMIEAHRNALVYKVFFERVFLKMLQYQGTYVDRASVGFPLRDLDGPP